MRRMLLVIAAAVGLLSGLLGAPAALAVQTPQSKLVSANPADWTPAVNDGAVRAIAQAGNTIVIGGTFTSVTPNGSTTPLARSYIAAFDATTGAMRSFAPTLDGPVDALVAAPDGRSVYVGGEFVNVNGVKAKSLARLDLTTGLAVKGFKTVVINGNVLDLKLSGNRLWVGGNFSKFATNDQPALATVDATTGKYDPYMQVPFAGTHNGGRTSIQKFDISPDGSKLLVIGNFTVVGGVAHDQAAMLDLTGPSAAVANWGTTFYTGSCARVFDSYMRDLDISPDGTYAVISTTGAYGGSTSPCDQTSRWEMGATGSGLTPTWTNYTGGDTTYAVAVTGTAVYVGGHFRWQNNAFAGDRAGAGSVAREGIAALDPANGLPLDWDPGRARGVGVFDMLATDQGLWVGSDTDRIGGWEVHPKIAFFPLAGGKNVLSTATPQLPGQVYLAGNTSATNTNVLYRVNAAGPALASLDGGPDWAADSGTTGSYRNTGSSVATYEPGATSDASVPPSTPNAVFDSERYDPAGGNEMQWAFPVPAGTHVQVRLYFANRCSCTSGVGQRRFNVSIDNVPKLTNFDIVADAKGSQIGEMKAFTITSDGTVNINFGHVTENPLVNAIELINSDIVLTGSPDDIRTRTFDGSTAGAATTLPTSGVSWSQARGGFYLNGIAYAGWSDGNLYARPFDGTTFGTPVNVNGMDQIAPLTTFHADVKNTTGMFFDSAQNRLYFTLTGSNVLYYRAFTPSTNVIGAVRYSAVNASNVNFANASMMMLSGGSLYVADRTTGNLLKVAFAGGTVSGTATTVSGPSIDGQAWYARAGFLAPAPGAPNEPPVAAFTSTCVGGDCVFDASTSTDGDGDITSYTWSFGDGDTAASSAPSHTFSTSGTFDVTLTVTDNGGDSSSITHQVTVAATNQPPVATFTSSCSALACSFDGSASTDPDGTVDAYSWTFGDGATSEDISPEHEFDSPGSYSVTLRVVDSSGAEDTYTQQVTVSATVANISFVGDDSTSANQRSVAVTVPAAVEEGDGLVLTATSASSSVTLTAPAGWAEVDSVVGTNVQTQIWQRVADASSAGSSVTVTQSDLAKLSVTLTAYSGTNTDAPVGGHALVAETANTASHRTPTLSTSLAGAWLVSAWADVSSDGGSWTTPSGQPVRAATVGTGGGHTSAVLTDTAGPLTVGTVGGYAATSTASGKRATMATLVLVPTGSTPPNKPPVAAFSSSCTALACSFDSSGSQDEDGSVTGYAWTFGDGATSTQASPSHTYAGAGSYSVTLTVTDDDGATDTRTQQVTVNTVASPITFVGSDTASVNARKATVTVPSAARAGNALVLFATVANDSAVVTPPSGWTEVDQVVDTQTRTVVWQRVATSALPGSAVTVQLDVQAKMSLMVAAYGGTSATAPVDGHATSAETSTTAAHTTPTLDTAAAGGWLLSYWADVTTATTAWTTPAGQSVRATAIGTGGGHPSAVLTDLGGPLTPGTVGGYTATADATSSKATMVTLVLLASS
jgi:PKD repeat protein